MTIESPRGRLPPGAVFAFLLCVFPIALDAQAAPGAPSAIDRALAETEGAAPAGDASGGDILRAPVGGAELRLIDFSLGLNGAAGGSSLDAEHLEALQGGFHDPRKKGFSLTSAELSIFGAVDPYFRLEAHMNFSDGAELEEIFAVSQALPYDLQIKLGRYFTEFGLINPTHPHAWRWMDAPAIHSRLFGGHGLNGDGVRVSWLAPLPWFSEVYVGAQNASGENMLSFLGSSGGGGHSHGGGEEAPPIGGYDTVEREIKSGSELVYLARFDNAVNVTDTITARIGLSGLAGPNATGPQGRTFIYGADFYVKWLPENNFRGFPFVIWQTELMRRDYVVHKAPNAGRLAQTWQLLNGVYPEPFDQREEFTRAVLESLLADTIGSRDQGDLGLLIDVVSGRTSYSSLTGAQQQQAVEAAIRSSNEFETLHDYGFYSQLLFGFQQGWSAGLRYEFASGSGESRVEDGDWLGRDLYGRDRDPLRDTRLRISPLLIWQPSEFSRFRLQYNQERADHLRETKYLTINLRDYNASLPSIPYQIVVERKSRLEWSAWFAVEFMIGYHPPHSF